jgi:glycosyltransferase involved in cell wall biosynthesis
MNELTSIIIPFYNGNPVFLRNAVISVKKLRKAKVELIIVDDGSCNVFSIKNLIKQCDVDFDVKILNHQNNLGIAAARNTAILNASGKWLLWLDCDDTLDERCIEIMREQHDDEYMIIGECNVYEKGSVLLRDPSVFFDLGRKHIRTPYDPFMTNIFSIQPQLVRRDAVLDMGMFDTNYVFAEMTDFFLRFLTYYGMSKISTVHGAYYNYNRDNENSVSRNRTQLEKYRYKTLYTYKNANKIPVDDILYLGRCVNTCTQLYVATIGKKIFLQPYISFNNNNLRIGE